MSGKNVLAVGAHADDVEIGCGGTACKKNGDKVVILVMTESSYSYYDGTVLRTVEEGVLEEENAAKVFIDKYNVDVIYTHWYHDSHQDHRRTTQSVLSAGRYVNNILMYEPE